jgi:hypothetical protein
MPPRHAVTFDVDWAPDWAITLCAEMCRDRGIPATFFSTHPSAVLDELARDPLFEVGIHPNFLRGSTHGATFEEVMAFCLKMVPDARAMRTHDLFGSSSLFAMIISRFGQIKTDSSLFLPGAARCEPTVFYHGTPVGALVRVPFSFADNVAARTPGWRWDAEPKPPAGLTVFNFHPSLIVLNLGKPDAYPKLKDVLGSRPFQSASREDFAPFVNAGAGAHTYMKHLLECLAPEDCATISAVAAAHASGIDRPQD